MRMARARGALATNIVKTPSKNERARRSIKQWSVALASTRDL
jgi:hypothetical protein